VCDLESTGAPSIFNVIHETPLLLGGGARGTRRGAENFFPVWMSENFLDHLFSVC
jgi:hypothetical protein